MEPLHGYWEEEEYWLDHHFLYPGLPIGRGAVPTASLPTSPLDHELVRDTGRTLENWRLTQASSPSTPTFVSLDSGLTVVITASSEHSTQEGR